MISVIIPCYNHSHFLKETVQSVLGSTYKDVEIIIVDDGSTDDSRFVGEMLSEQSANVHYIYQKNAGPSAARNNGIRHSKGVYILPLDADDIISKDYLMEAINVLEKKPKVKVVYSQAEKFGAVNKIWRLKRYSIEALAMDNMIFVSAVYRKVDWERVGGYTEKDVLVREDWEFWIKLLKDGGDVVKLPFVGFYYRIHDASRRKSMSKEKKNAEIDYLNLQHADFFQKNLGGPLRKARSLSRLINYFYKK